MHTISKRLEAVERAAAALAGEEEGREENAAETLRILDAHVPLEEQAAFCDLYLKLRDGTPFDEAAKELARKYHRCIIALGQAALARMQVVKSPARA